ncbi:MAG: hypothetical protein ABL973_18065 [Micropepsaceae bacterium]
MAGAGGEGNLRTCSWVPKGDETLFGRWVKGERKFPCALHRQTVTMGGGELGGFTRAVMKRYEPVASVVEEALTGYASGRFETQAEVMRFLQENPLFPKDGTGIVRHSRVGALLANCVYAGCIEAPEWGVSLREACRMAALRGLWGGAA